MGLKKATTAIFINKLYPKGEKKQCAISIRVTFDRKHKYYSTGHSLSIKDFENKKPRKLVKEIILEIQAKEMKAAKIIEDLPQFSFALFEKRYLLNQSPEDSIYESFDHYIKSLINNGQIGTSYSYQCARNSIEKFRPGLKFSDITSDLLHAYEKWMLNDNKTKTTVGIYLRSLRSIFNKAIEDELINKNSYPFGRRKYEIPSGGNTKKALSLSDIALIYNYKSENKIIQRSKDYWLFLYLGNGMNMKDMCLLKYENIKDNFIEFQRAKTARTKRKTEFIRVPLTKDLKAIIEKHGNKDKQPGSHIFPILTKKLTPIRERQLIQQITRNVNDHMKIITDALNIKIKATTYSARHSFATILQRSGMAISFISEALGHANVLTTQNYLAGFTDDEKIEAAGNLTRFKKIIKK